MLALKALSALRRMASMCCAAVLYHAWRMRLLRRVKNSQKAKKCRTRKLCVVEGQGFGHAMPRSGPWVRERTHVNVHVSRTQGEIQDLDFVTAQAKAEVSRSKAVCDSPCAAARCASAAPASACA